MDDRRRDGGTNSTLKTKEQGTHLTLNEHDDDDDDDDIYFNSLYASSNLVVIIRRINCIDTINSPDDEHEVARNM